LSEIIGSAEVEVFADTSQMQKQAEAGGKKAGQKAGGAFTSSFKRSAAAFGAGFLGAAGVTAGFRQLSRLGKQSVDVASNLNEQLSKTRQVFGEASKSVEAFSVGTSNRLGLAKDQVLEIASSFGALLRPLGATEEAAAKQSTALTTLGADLASFYNTDVADALAAIKSGLVGETEPLRRYGVVLTEARIKQEALVQSGKKSAEALTNQEKVLARISLIYKDTALAQGDFQRTSDGLANQQRILAAAIRDTEAGIGAALLPTVNEVTKSFAEWISKTENQQKIANATRQTVDVLTVTFKGLATAVDLAVTPFVRIGQVSHDATVELDKLLSKVPLVGDFLSAGPEGLSDEEIKKKTQLLIAQQRERRRLGTLTDASDRTAAVPGAGPPGADDLEIKLGSLRTSADDAGFAIKRLRAELSKGTEDDAALFNDRKAFLQRQISRLEEAGLRGKNDKARLESLYKELSQTQGNIDSIEKQAADARRDAIEQRALDAKKEKEEAQAKLREAAEAKKAAEERKRALVDSRLQLRVQRAELTKTNTDDIAAQQTIIKVYKERAERFRKQRDFVSANEAMLTAISAKGRIQDIKSQEKAEKEAKAKARASKTGTDRKFTPTDFFSEAAANFKQFGSNIASRNGILSGQDARGALGGLALERRSNTQSLLNNTVVSQLKESQVTNEILRSIRDVLQGTSRASGSQPPARVSAAAEKARQYAFYNGGAV
jgi:hypothetical protein